MGINLNYSENSHCYLNRNSKDLQIQWISIIQKPNKVILLGNMYRPPQGNIEHFIEIMDDTLSNLNLTKVELIIMGDFNIDVSDTKNPATKKLIELSKQYGLRQIIKEPTCYTETKSSCIDHGITNSDIITHVGTTNVNISDHQMIMLTRKQLKKFKKCCDFYGRSYRNYNKIDFQRRLQETQ